MPATYAHYRFGKNMIPKLSDKLQKIIHTNRELYDIGVHGPDILFYNEAYHQNSINTIGFKMHDELASKFFKTARLEYVKYEEKDAMLAYILGFVSHFCLDYTDHSYVEIKEIKSHISHTLIEEEYDRHLILKDGLNPFKKDPVEHIHASSYNAKIISYFFPNIKRKEIHKSLKHMIFFLRLLKSSNTAKRLTLNSIFKLMNKEDSLSDHVLKLDINEKCLDSNLRLDKLELNASKLFIELSENIYAYLNGQADIDPRFNKTFSYQENYKDIPVYDIEKEKIYEI